MFYALTIVLIVWIIWNKTALGKNMFAIGGNKEAAKVCGVNVRKTIIIVYLIAGILYAFGDVLEAGRTGSANSIRSIKKNSRTIARVLYNCNTKTKIGRAHV